MYNKVGDYFPWIILLFIILVICLVPEIQFEMLQPMFTVGYKPLIKAALSVAGTSSLPFIVLSPLFINRVAISF
ncbi:hypothetical protein [Paenibacillus sp. LjRoot56]|uniref:hypothetical protein n=1 Tax=Paenibacillus sp. LjRoot56 TaxID=3342333 RepID=UPI003F5020E8